MRDQPSFDLAKARERISELERLVHVPGLWRCAKCGFALLQSNLNALDGTVTARDEPGSRCPNDGAPLWRVTERENGRELMERLNAMLSAAADASRAP